GPEVVGSDEYKRALNKEQEALALVTTDPGEAVKGLRDATNLYTRATESVQTIITRRSEADAAAAKDGPRSDEDLVRATLTAYERAYAMLDAAAVKRVFPNADATQLTRDFGSLSAQQLHIDNPQVTVTGTTATVTAHLRQSGLPKDGMGWDSASEATFRLQKNGDRWVIVERR
ncbi:MAG: nuclear transport factor 2 family protein, partial [Vicinamibacterales bacterium]